jgi:organic radical activating enzyme
MSEHQTFPGRKIFPIKNDPACLLKWSWSTINMETATTSSCHRVKDDPIDPENFNNFHNVPAKIKARQDMINGQWPGRGCEYCQNVEQHGGTSDRQMTLMRSHGLDKIPPELLADPGATHVTPIILEIYFNNTCNLSCVYCGPSVSSKLNDELLKYGPIRIDDFTVDPFKTNNTRYSKMIQDLWNYLEQEDRYKIIRHFHVLGGEPLLQKELDNSLEFWKNHPNPSLTFNMISNIMVPHKLFVEKMKKFQDLVESEAILELELTASIDCWGAAQEYARHGLNLDTWIKNFEYMLDKPWVRLSLHSCITALTIKTMPELISKIVQWNQQRPPEKFIEHSFDVVVGKPYEKNGLHPALFGPGVFDKDFEEILKIMPVDNEMQISARKQMQGLAKFIHKSMKNPERIAILKTYLDELDRRRNTNWRRVFPWLVDID